MDSIDVGKETLTTVRKVDINNTRFRAGIYNLDRTPVNGSVEAGRDYLAKIGKRYVRVRAAGLGNEMMYPARDYSTEEDDVRFMAVVASGYDPDTRQYKF